MELSPRAVALLLAALLFAVGAFWRPPPSPRISLVSLGLFLLAVAMLVPG